MLPLPVALSKVLGQIAADAEDRAGVGETMPSLAVWSNALRCVAGSPGLDEKELASAARISKRLATAAVTGAARRGWIVTEAAGGKNRRSSLSESGGTAAETWPEVLGALDIEWAGSPLRSALESLVPQFRFELPHYPASYGTADPSATGGTFVQNAPRKDDLPAHGTDWRPVIRNGHDVSVLPITALLSQVLMAFTIDYEDRFPWPLASTLSVLVHIGDGALLSELPEGHGITATGKSLLERHLIVDVEKLKPRDHRVTLSFRGKQVIEHHPKRLEAVEKEWDERYGSDLIGALRSALDPIATGPAAGQRAYVEAPLHLG